MSQIVTCHMWFVDFVDKLIKYIYKTTFKHVAGQMNKIETLEKYEI